MNKAKAEAEKIKERFKEPILVSPEGDVCMTFKTLDDKQSTQCAIIDVKHTIEHIESMYPHPRYGSELDRYQSILTELENK